MKLKLLDLFSGIGGFSLGLERSGAFETVAFCEREPFCQHIIKKHWPGVAIYDDVETLTAARLEADGISVDAICGGFPCQDISLAGAGAGLDGKRSGLWWQFHRLIKEIRPSWVIIENVSALRSRGLDRILGGLAEIGYDAEWHCIPASAVGAPHQRDRIWIIAYPNDKHGWPEPEFSIGEGWKARLEPSWSSSNVADTDDRRARWRQQQQESCEDARHVANVDSAQCEGGGAPSRVHPQYADLGSGGWWETEPDVGRVADGVPARMDRLRALGNAVVPQIPQVLGEMIASRMEGR